MRRLSVVTDWRINKVRVDETEHDDLSKAFWDGVFSISNTQKSSQYCSKQHCLDNDYIQSKRDREESLLGDRWIIYPTDIRKVAWDCLSCAAVIYAVAEVPFSIGFLSDVEGSLSSNVTDGLFVAIFGIDILLSFNSAYEDTATGLLVSNRLKIAKRYSKFWLWIDLAAMIPINQIVASLHPTGSKNNLNSTSLLRLCRLSRLAFLYKMLNSQRLSTYMDSINISPQIKNITLLFLQIFLTGHVVCCFWFFITTQTVIGVLNPTDDAVLIHTWATDFGFQNIDIFSQYIASLYWTFATLFTIGYGDISATNEGERVFSIAVMLLGSILFGAIIAKIKDVLDSRNIQKNEIIVKMEEFKEYMEEKSFPSHLRFQAKEAYLYYLDRRPSLSEKGLFNVLPRALKIKVLNLKYRKEIMSIDLFQNIDMSFVVHLLMNSKPYQMRCGDTVYGCGDVSEELSFLIRGSVGIYVPKNKMSQREISAHASGYATSGGYFGDFEFVKPGPRTADYIAEQHCSLLSISYSCLSEAIKDSPTAGAVFLSKIKARSDLFGEQMRKCATATGMRSPMRKDSLPEYFTDRFRSRSRSRSLTTCTALSETIWVDGEFKASASVQLQFLTSEKVRKWMIVKESLQEDGTYKDHVVEMRLDELKALKLLMPKETLKFFWDAFIGLLIIYSLLTLPLQLAFDSYSVGGSYDGLLISDFSILGFFFLDILATFNTAYYSEKDDAYVTIRRLIADQYFRTWFIVDLISCIPFDTIVAAGLEDVNRYKSIDKFSTIQLVKTIRLLRLMKLMKLLETRKQFTIFFESLQISPAVVTIGNLLLTITVTCHFLACVWWGVSSRLSDSPWYEVKKTDFTHDKFSEQYVTAMYLAVTTLTSTGYGDLGPTNTSERCMTILIFIFGALVYGYITAKVAATIGNIGRNGARSDKFTHQIREYLDSDEISNKFLWEVIGHAKKVLRRSSVFNEELILERLPLHLRLELVLYDNREALESLALFRFIKNHTVKLEILRIMTSSYADKGRCIMKEGDAGGGIVFLISGSAVISCERMVKKVTSPRRESFGKSKSSRFILQSSRDLLRDQTQAVSRMFGRDAESSRSLRNIPFSKPSKPTAPSMASSSRDDVEGSPLDSDRARDRVAFRGGIGSMSGSGDRDETSRFFSLAALECPSQDDLDDKLQKRRVKDLPTDNNRGRERIGTSFQRVLNLKFNPTNPNNLEDEKKGGKIRPTWPNLRSPLSSLFRHPSGSNDSMKRDVYQSDPGTRDQDSTPLENAEEPLTSVKYLSLAQTLKMKHSVDDSEVSEGIVSRDNTAIPKSKSFFHGVGSYVYSSNGARVRSDKHTRNNAADRSLEVLGALSGGDFIGYKEIHKMLKHPVSLTASEPCWYYTLDRTNVLSLVRYNPYVAFEFQRALGLAIGEMDRKLQSQQKQKISGEFFTEMKENFRQVKAATNEKRQKQRGLTTLLVQLQRGRDSMRNLRKADGEELDRPDSSKSVVSVSSTASRVDNVTETEREDFKGRKREERKDLNKDRAELKIGRGQSFRESLFKLSGSVDSEDTARGVSAKLSATLAKLDRLQAKCIKADGDKEEDWGIEGGQLLHTYSNLGVTLGREEVSCDTDEAKNGDVISIKHGTSIIPSNTLKTQAEVAPKMSYTRTLRHQLTRTFQYRPLKRTESEICPSTPSYSVKSARPSLSHQMSTLKTHQSLADIPSALLTEYSHSYINPSDSSAPGAVTIRRTRSSVM